MKYQILAAAASCMPLWSCAEQSAPKVEPKPVAQPRLEPPTAVLAAVVTAPAAVPAKADPQKALAEKVKRALEGETPHLHAAAIDVTAAPGGVVTLWGTADSEDEKIRASRIAYRIAGVNKVENKLAVVKGS